MSKRDNVDFPIVNFPFICTKLRQYIGDDGKIFEMITSIQQLEILRSVASLIAATLYQGNHD
jgi:hypothetical protein